MSDIVALLHCLDFRHLVEYDHAAIEASRFRRAVHPDRVTMRGIARWTERGGSYRTVQRWYHTPVAWAMLLWTVIQSQLLNPESEYLLAGDEVVISKACF